MIIGCKEYYETVCPDYPEKCTLCGNFVDNRKVKKMYRVQYLLKGKNNVGVWKYVRDSNNVPVSFYSIYDARNCMNRTHSMGYDTRIVENNEWIEKKEW